MKHKIYSVYDEAAAAYLPPFITQTDAMAERMFCMACVDENHQFNKHSHDYSLWCIGTFNDENADIKKENTYCIAKGHELLARSNAYMAIQEKGDDNA